MTEFLLKLFDELLKDSKRLKWLGNNSNGSLSSKLYLGGPWRYIDDQHPAEGYWKFDERPDLGRYEDLRDAIDAGMIAESDKPSGASTQVNTSK